MLGRFVRAGRRLFPMVGGLSAEITVAAPTAEIVDRLDKKGGALLQQARLSKRWAANPPAPRVMIDSLARCGERTSASNRAAPISSRKRLAQSCLGDEIGLNPMLVGNARRKGLDLVSRDAIPARPGLWPCEEGEH